MYQDFSRQFDAGFAADQRAPAANGSIEEVPDFLWHAPANEDDTLDSIVILGEN